MYRRRRVAREKIFFSFDSFLDVVANVIGVIIRLILVTWVGARAYTETMRWVEPEPTTEGTPVVVAPRPAARAEDDPLSPELDKARKEIDRVRQKLLEQLRQLELVQSKEKEVRDYMTAVGASRQELDRQKQTVETIREKKDLQARYAALSLDELRQKSVKLTDEIRELEKKPVTTKVLRYHTPVSRPVRSDEVFFECRGGKIAFIDIAAFKHEMDGSVRDLAKQLRTQWEVTAKTAPVGAFRMQYVIERVRDYADGLAGNAPPPNANFSYGLSGWVLEPITENRGETFDVAMAASSQFRQVMDGLDAKDAVVTLWVYPDSFALFRQMRDLLYERDIEVAARPLPEGAPIVASRHGTASRGQ